MKFEFHLANSLWSIGDRNKCHDKRGKRLQKGIDEEYKMVGWKVGEGGAREGPAARENSTNTLMPDKISEDEVVFGTYSFTYALDIHYNQPG